MCLQTKWKKPRIATKDKIVYKLLDDDTNSKKANAPFNSFIYDLGKVYKTKILETNNWSAFDHMAEFTLRSTNRKELISIGEGFHSAKTKKRLKDGLFSDRNIYRCIIPKGSKYYVGLTDLIVSDKIKIVKKIT